MPHDKDGREVKRGQRVTVEFIVTDVQPGEEYCNATLSSAEPMYPGKDATTLTINTKQCVVTADAAEEPKTEPAASTA